MDYKKVLRLHFVSKMSGRDIATLCGCSKTTVNEFLRRFNKCQELSYPLSKEVTNELIEQKLYHKTGPDAELYRDFDKEAVYKALARKGETLKHQWQKYIAKGSMNGLATLSYRQFCRRYSEWSDSKKITFHIQRYPGINMELDFAGKKLVIHSRSNPLDTVDVTIFISALTYSDYFYIEGMTRCDIQNWIRVNNNALKFFGGVTQTVTPDNCKVAVTENKDWIDPTVNKDFQAWAEHNNTVVTPAKVKSPRNKPVVEGHVKIVTMHILTEMEEMTFYSLEELNKVLWDKMDIENHRCFQGLNYSRWDIFRQEEKETLLSLPETCFEYLERKTVRVNQDFSFTFDKVHYSMPRKYLKKELEIRAEEKTIYVYNKQGDLIREHQRSYTPKSWVVIPSDMPKEYHDYGYWNVPYFQSKAADIGPYTRAVIDAVIKKFDYPVQSFRSCFGILNYAKRYTPETLERCCHDAFAAGRCNYTYICNTITAYIEEAKPQMKKKSTEAATNTSGTFKDDDSRYSLKSLIHRQEARHE